MKSSKKGKKKIFTYKNNFFLFIIFGFFFLSIGYAAINAVIMNVTGRASAKMASNIYISNVVIDLDTTVDADISVSNPTYSKKFFQDTIKLSNSNLESSITYKITIHNGSIFDYSLEDIFNETILDMYINDNPDIVMEYTCDNGNIIHKESEKDVYVTFKYADNLETIVDNEVNAALNFDLKAIANIDYLGFDDVSGYPTSVLEGETLTITFDSSINYIAVSHEDKILVRNRDYTFVNHVLTYDCEYGGTIIVNGENNYEILDSFPTDDIVPNSPFTLTGEDYYPFNADNKTFFIEVDLANITRLGALDNIISIGTEMHEFRPLLTGGINLHIYYPDATGKIIISPIMKEPIPNSTATIQIKAPLNTINSKIARFAFNANGLYYNGIKLMDSSGINQSFTEIASRNGNIDEAYYFNTFFTRFSADLQVKIGSREGNNRSNAAYHDVIIFDEKLTDEEMVRITEINEEPRTDYSIIELLDPNNPIIPNQPFTLYQNEDFNIANQTLLVEMDVSNSIYEFENLLSLGKQISGWRPTTSGDAHLHIFYTHSTNKITVAPLLNSREQKQYEKDISLIEGKYIKVAFSNEGLYINGEKIFDKNGLGNNLTDKNGNAVSGDSAYLTAFYAPWLAGTGNYNIDIGSTQGDSRSNATYTKFEICDIPMYAYELIHYTL